MALDIHEKHNAGFSNGFCGAQDPTEKSGAQRSDGDERSWDRCCPVGPWSFVPQVL